MQYNNINNLNKRYNCARPKTAATSIFRKHLFLFKPAFKQHCVFFHNMKSHEKGHIVVWKLSGIEIRIEINVTLHI